jgi:hypothetical protein
LGRARLDADPDLDLSDLSTSSDLLHGDLPSSSHDHDLRHSPPASACAGSSAVDEFRDHDPLEMKPYFLFLFFLHQ